MGDGPGRVTAEACLAACMRLSPDRIFLAELRGSEAWEYVLSLNTGHPGSVTTTHANGAVQVFERIASLIATQMVGLAYCRYVLRLPALLATPRATLVRTIGATIHRYLDSSLA